VADEIWVCGDQTLTRFNGTIEDFKQLLKDEVESEQERN